MRITGWVWGVGQEQSQLRWPPQALAPTRGHDLGSTGLFSKQARSQDRRVIDDPVVNTTNHVSSLRAVGGSGYRQKLRLEGTELDNPFSRQALTSCPWA